jgi:DNA topoisomerase-1
MGREFTAKDFRTWGGTVAVVAELLAAEPDQLDSEAAKAATLRRAIKVAAERLGNTPAVTRSSYVDPRVIEAVNDPGRLTTVRRWNPAPAQYLSTAEQKTLKLLRG